MKNILILGAGSDMAQAIARKFAMEGWSLTLAARDPQRLEALAGDLHVRSGCEVTICAFDAQAYDTHGSFYDDLEVSPDAVACVFGYLGDAEKAHTDFSEADRIISTNYTGAVSILNVVAEDFEIRRDGVIIGISSVAGDRGRQSNYMYGSAKAGFSTYLSGLRNRLAKSSVHVMTVKPGFCHTRMTENMDLPAGLTATPDQVAEAVYKGVRRKRNVVYTLGIWRWIMWAIRMIPEALFKRMRL